MEHVAGSMVNVVEVGSDVTGKSDRVTMAIMAIMVSPRLARTGAIFMVVLRRGVVAGLFSCRTFFLQTNMLHDTVSGSFAQRDGITDVELK